MNICDWLDKYRDGELDDAAKFAFTAHLAACEDCRLRMALLNNLVSVLKQETIPVPDLADYITRKAFQKTASWDVLVASWLRPKLAMAAVGVALALFSCLWFMPANKSMASYTEFEILLNKADASDLAGKLLVNNDNELALQCMQGGIVQ